MSDVQTMSVEEWRKSGQRGRVAGTKRAKGISGNKAVLFANAWQQWAPPNAPKLKPEFRFEPSRKWRADFRVGRHKLLIEVEGATRRANGGRHNTDGDRHKTNVAAALGYRVMRFSTEILATDPAGCVALVLKAIKMKGIA